MKGLVFHDQLEIRAEIDGEEFCQGDSIPCTLTITNRSGESRTLDSLTLQLALADPKKVKAKMPNAFETFSSSPELAAALVAPNEKHCVSWNCNLDVNCPLTEKSRGIFLVYGAGSGAQGQLEIPLKPHRHIEGILGVFETSFQFALKGMKWKDGWVIAKFKAPDGKRFSTIDELSLALKHSNDGLDLRYSFKVKRLEATATSLSVQKKVIEGIQEWRASDYLARAGYIDPELIEPKVERALELVVSKLA